MKSTQLPSLKELKQSHRVWEERTAKDNKEINYLMIACGVMAIIYIILLAVNA